MLLNGDGKTNIKKDDSLENIDKYANSYDIVVCNPPFGTKITEKKSEVLRKFDLGFEHEYNEGKFEFDKTKKLLNSQEMGLLFVEACIKQSKPLGRIGIILPNGYLGNRSNKYKIFREWLVKQVKIVSLVSFPRFTFKSSGADVSATAVFLEKRETPLETIPQDDYFVAVEMIEKVGWEAGNKRVTPVYKRNIEDGSFYVNDEGERIIDSDFRKVLNSIRNSKANLEFPWLRKNQQEEVVEHTHSWYINIKSILNDPVLTLDPKRYSRKVSVLREQLKKNDYLILGDLVDFIPEKTTSTGKNIKIELSNIYQYVELQDMGYGNFDFHEKRGWELPDRARHFGEEGDFYFGAIWGSVIKWCYLGQGVENIVLTNGCHRCRIKKGMENYLLDLLAYVNTEGWGTQLRALARGSDGLAEVVEEDAKTVIIPKIQDDAIRNELKPFIESLKKDKLTLNNTVSNLIKNKKWNISEPDKRPSHIVLV